MPDLKMYCPQGVCFGEELSKIERRSCDVWAEEFLMSFVSWATPRRKILDLGGGSGERAEQFVRLLDADVTVIDIRESQMDIDARNKHLGREAIQFIQADITNYNGPDLQDEHWDLINVCRIVHFHFQPEVREIFSFLAGIAQSNTRIAVNFACSDSLTAQDGKGPRTIYRTEGDDEENVRFRLHDSSWFRRMTGELGYRTERYTQEEGLCLMLLKAPALSKPLTPRLRISGMHEFFHPTHSLRSQTVPSLG